MKKGLFMLSFAALFFCDLFNCTAQNIYTIAGTVASGYTGDNGPATLAELFHPKGTTTDAAGNVYIADADNNVIRKIDLAGIITTIAGYPAGGYSGDGGPASIAGLSRPNSIVIDHANNIFISDADNQRIRKIDASGTITTIAGDGTAAYFGDGGPATAAEINYPGSIALDKNGNIYIADEYNNRIRKIDTFGVIATVIGNGTTGYIGDEERADTAAIGFPFGVAVDDSLNIYFSLTLNNMVCKVNTSNMLTTIAGNSGAASYSGDAGPATAATLNNPWGIAVDRLHNVYICDNANERIRKIDTAGIITTIAGNGSSGFSGDGGPAIGAKLQDPAGVNVDAIGNIYIADYNNHRIRRVNDTLPVTVIATTTVKTVQTNDRISVYPNPAAGHFTVLITSGTTASAAITITNVLGETVFETVGSTNLPIDISPGLANGVYIVNTKYGNEQHSTRISVISH